MQPISIAESFGVLPHGFQFNSLITHKILNLQGQIIRLDYFGAGHKSGQQKWCYTAMIQGASVPHLRYPPCQGSKSRLHRIRYSGFALHWDSSMQGEISSCIFKL